MKVIQIGKDITRFTDLNDVPSDYTGNAGKAVVVNDTENGLVFETVGEDGIPILGTVNTFADLPDVVANADKTYIVLTSTGAFWSKRKGLYYSDGITWSRLSNPTLKVNDTEMKIVDDVDPTKELQFQLDTISTGTTRTLTIQDKDGIVATLSDILVDSVNGYTGVVVLDADDLADGTTNAIITLTQETNFETAYSHSQITTGNPHSVTKAEVGLGNVDNTSDADKPISDDTQTALDLKANDSEVVHNTGDENVGGVKTFSDDVIISGDLTVNGTTTTVNTDELLVEDNIITVNNGESGAGVTAGSAGLQVDRGTATDYQILFDESDDSFKIGEIGSLQKVATREDTPTDSRLAYWDNTSSSFKTDRDVSVDSSGNLTTTGGITTGGEIEFSDSLNNTGTGIVSPNGITLMNSDATVGNYTTIQNRDANGDQNCQIQFINKSHASNQGEIAFTTRGGTGEFAEKMRLDSTGNLDVTGGGTFGGTSTFNPGATSASLELRSDSNYRAVSLKDRSEVDKGYLLHSGNKVRLVSISGELELGSNNTINATLDTSGNLDVAGNITSGNGTGNVLIKGVTGTGTDLQFQQTSSIGRFVWLSNTGSDIMTLTNSGNLSATGRIKGNDFQIEDTSSTWRFESSSNVLRFVESGVDVPIKINPTVNGSIEIGRDLDVTGGGIFGDTLDVTGVYDNQFFIRRDTDPTGQYSKISGGASLMRFTSFNDDGTHSLFEWKSNNGTTTLTPMTLNQTGDLDVTGGVTSNDRNHIILNDSGDLSEGLRLSNTASNSDTIIMFEEGGSTGSGSMFCGFDGGANKFVISKVNVSSPYHFAIERDSGNLSLAGNLDVAGGVTAGSDLVVSNGANPVLSVDISEYRTNFGSPTGSTVAYAEYERVATDRTLTIGNNSAVSTGGVAIYSDTLGSNIAKFNNSGNVDMAGNIDVAGVYKTGGTSGVSGSFTTTDGKTITIINGIVTSIV